MKRKTPQSLKADAAHLRKLAADMIVKATEMDREARAMESDVLDEDHSAEVVTWYFNMTRRMRAAH